VQPGQLRGAGHLGPDPAGTGGGGLGQPQPGAVADGQTEGRLRPMRGLKRHRSARILAAGHAFVQNLRRGHYDIATEVPSCHRLRAAFDDLALAIRNQQSIRIMLRRCRRGHDVRYQI
jgi:hypothetical protein